MIVAKSRGSAIIGGGSPNARRQRSIEPASANGIATIGWEMCFFTTCLLIVTLHCDKPGAKGGRAGGSIL